MHTRPSLQPQPQNKKRQGAAGVQMAGAVVYRRWRAGWEPLGGDDRRASAGLRGIDGAGSGGLSGRQAAKKRKSSGGSGEGKKRRGRGADGGVRTAY